MAYRALGSPADATAERLEGDARKAEEAGQRASARGPYLRTANYLSTGLYLITHSSAPERQLDIWRRHRACWDKVVDLSVPPGERLQIRYEDATLPGYFLRAPDAEPGERRPLVVLNNGSDGATSHMGLFGGLAANEPGYHAMTFDGPGQLAALFLQGIPFRPDWEAVLTPVMDVSTSWTGRLPGFMRAQLQDPSKKESFDKEMGWTERLSKSTRATLHFRGDPYGVAGDSRFDLYQEVLRYRLGDEVANITTPDHRPRTSSSGRASPRRCTTCRRAPGSWSGSPPPRAPTATASRWAWPSATPASSAGSPATAAGSRPGVIPPRPRVSIRGRPVRIGGRRTPSTGGDGRCARSWCSPA